MNTNTIRAIAAAAASAVIGGCVVSPEMVRRQPSRDTQVIPAPRAAVAACIAKQLRATSSYETVEGADSVHLKSGDVTLRIYDLRDAAGGTMVTLFVQSVGSLYVAESLAVLDHCRGQLGAPK